MRDTELRQDILDELEYEPTINAADIGVGVADGVVTLSGHVDSYLQKVMAEAAVRRVRGVRAIAESIAVRIPGHKRVADDEIAARALDIIAWDTALSDNKISVKVEHGWVTLSGQVDWHFERTVAESAVRKLGGVTGVTNLIAVVPAATSTGVADAIEKALKRNAAIEASQVKVSLADGTVKLEGNVMAWKDRELIEKTAWSSAGVRKVDNRLTIGGYGRSV